MDSQDFDVLSDDELRETLRQNGISCGPVTPSTRSLYIKKLRKSLGAGTTIQEPEEISVAAQEQPQLTPTRVRGTPSIYPVLSPKKKRREMNLEKAKLSDGSGSDSDMCGEEEVRYLQHDSSSSKFIGESQSFKKTIFWIVMSFVMAVLAYFFVANIEKFYLPADSEPL